MWVGGLPALGAVGGSTAASDGFTGSDGVAINVGRIKVLIHSQGLRLITEFSLGFTSISIHRANTSLVVDATRNHSADIVSAVDTARGHSANIVFAVDTARGHSVNIVFAVDTARVHSKWGGG
jgi:hypothetical protein